VPLKEKRGRKSFDRDFKREAIGLIMVEGRSVAETARNIGVHENTLYKWLRDRRLRRENASLKEDSAILKKALAIFGGRRV